MTQRISFSPGNPSPGGQLTICYDFSGLTGEQSVTLTLEWEPSDCEGPGSVTVTPQNTCATITVPDCAEGLQVTDPTGNSEPNSISFEPEE